MAFGDYGAICKKDGVFINRDNFLMDAPEGFPQKVLSGGREYPLKDLMGHGILGDPDFFVIFYKGGCTVVEDGKVMERSPYYSKFLSETFFYKKADLTVSILDKEKHFDETLEDVVQEVEEFDEFLKGCSQKLPGGKKRYLRKQIRALVRRRKNRSLWAHSSRWHCSWEKDGHKYEAIFGYMVDPEEETWKAIRNEMGFSEAEIRIIDEWFGLGDTKA